MKYFQHIVANPSKVVLLANQLDIALEELEESRGNSRASLRRPASALRLRYSLDDPLKRKNTIKFVSLNLPRLSSAGEETGEFGLDYQSTYRTIDYGIDWLHSYSLEKPIFGFTANDSYYKN